MLIRCMASIYLFGDDILCCDDVDGSFLGASTVNIKSSNLGTESKLQICAGFDLRGKMSPSKLYLLSVW